METATVAATAFTNTFQEYEHESDSPPPENNFPGYYFSDDSDDEFYNDGLRRMNDDERDRYRKEFKESDGFYVSDYPNVSDLGLIMPGCLISKSCLDTYEFFAKFAIEKEGANIEFVKIVNTNVQAAGPLNYYITFEAKDLADGLMKTYQALVYRFIPVERSEVGLFRLKPGQEA